MQAETTSKRLRSIGTPERTLSALSDGAFPSRSRRPLLSRRIQPRIVHTTTGVSMVSRRDALIRSAVDVAGSMAMLRTLDATAEGPPTTKEDQTHDRRAEASAYTPVTVPNGKTLPWKMVDGAKVFHLIAEPLKHEFAP